jgi:hypothetical protein
MRGGIFFHDFYRPIDITVLGFVAFFQGSIRKPPTASVFVAEDSSLTFFDLVDVAAEMLRNREKIN